jgi:hypothetical protein
MKSSLLLHNLASKARWILPEVHLEGKSTRVGGRHGCDGQCAGGLQGEVPRPIARFGTIEGQDLCLWGRVAVSQAPSPQIGRLKNRNLMENRDGQSHRLDSGGVRVFRSTCIYSLGLLSCAA